MSLDTVREAALAASAAEAEEIRQAAQERAEQIVMAARAQADALVRQRLRDAQALADAYTRGEMASAHSDARASVLRAQRLVLGEAIAAARSQARRLTLDPRYERMLARVGTEARMRLGDGAELSIVPARSGGVIARAGSRELDYSLDAQIERSLEAFSAELEGLWR